MSIASEIYPHIPYLRRYARALAGTQAGGDAYVGEVLEALVADPSAFGKEEKPRVELYRVFSSLWQSIDVNIHGRETPQTTREAVAGARLNEMTPLARQAFLLLVVEGFSVRETARILGLNEERVSQLIDEAGREIAQQVATDVLIIEDEPIISLDLEQIVRSLGHRVQAVARTHGDALVAVRDRRPGLVLADIQLADGSSGINAVNDMLVGFEVPVVFITAYPERLLTGDKPEPAFLIAKPFQAEVVKAVISQALFFNTMARPPARAIG
jgi:DNA-directed RNA polymerase specialized sigma24 family protein